MKKNLLALLLLAAFALSSCSLGSTRTVEVIIPAHPWERALGQNLWYTLKWTSGDQTHALHVNRDQRRVSVDVPIGETVVFAAYPLGELNPFGAVLTPLHPDPSLLLSQNEGCLANELLTLDREVVRRLNYGLALEQMLGKCDDLRCIEKMTLLRDLQNGVLSETSFKVVSLFGVDPFSLPNGIWTSEYTRDASIISKEGMTGQLQLPEGVFHYLNTEMSRVLVLIVDSGGQTYSYLRAI